ncbi:glucose-6-phosphate 1-dehydrogenase [Azoarcus sp. CIB]|uniref:glucose-6-phosphate dehydrogenase n=1 Tax=Aromatoleum sp. (strain CIB) TaxID=198107 RepID=UPI00067D3D55|nr:glucose-6-phosphate dehydrogenase [Azoarcus sp. CIB]AKU11169.1 glucose-6-phosphate 1-dehydrogenase [Azoarcus sp. CIB]
MIPLEAFDLVLFGGSGDLAMRKLLPALYYRHRDSVADGERSRWRIVGIAREDLTREAYIAKVEAHARKFVAAHDFDADAWAAFASTIDYVRLDAREAGDYGRLGAALADNPARVRVFYLATAPGLFASTCENLGAAGLVTADSRVVLEKPLGRDLDSAREINAHVGAIFKEEQIYRIDHYLGKETVQNLIALRFGNTLFEPLWSRGCVRDVQISLAETVGVEGRGEFYDNTGALRDMVQNHLLQLLCIVAMEPPANIDPDAMRDEKLKVLRALRAMTPEDVATRTVRGQYRAGAVDGRPVPGYLEEPGIAPNSRTETFVALKAELNNWRWAGVPFYLRTGKRMQERLAEIVVNFRDVPHALFPSLSGERVPNRLVIRLQPDEGLELHLMAKVPGDEMRLRPVALNLDFADTYHGRQWDAYERLLMDVIRGKLTLFMRRDELDAAWRWVEPILDGWEQDSTPPRPYTAGTWGPAASSALVGRDGLAWRQDS